MKDEIIVSDVFLSQALVNPELHRVFPVVQEWASNAKKSGCGSCGKSKAAKAELDKLRKFILSLGPTQAQQFKASLNIPASKKLRVYVRNGDRIKKVDL